ncbi:638_t:CDS:2, partial [Gigaspora rosea]
FFTALSRVYDYYKSGKVGEYFRNQSEKKQMNFLNKQREFYDDEKKKKENRFKKNEFAIVSLKNMKCYNCGRKGHLMSDCRSKKQDKGYNKGKKFSKERFSKDRKERFKKSSFHPKDSSGQYEKKYKLFNKEKYKDKKSGVITVKQTHILPIAVINTERTEQYHLENEYSSSDEESQSYQEPEQYESSSESDGSDEYESYNLEKKTSESENKNNYYF